MDDVFVVFGKVIDGPDGRDVLEKIENDYGTPDGEPKAKIVIHSAGIWPIA